MPTMHEPPNSNDISDISQRGVNSGGGGALDSAGNPIWSIGMDEDGFEVAQTSLTTQSGVNSFKLGEMHTMSSGGENIFFHNEVSDISWFPLWAGYKSLSDGVDIYIPPTARVPNHDVVTVQPNGSVVDSVGGVSYEQTVTLSDNETILGLSVVLAEDYKGVVYYIMRDTNNLGIIKYKHRTRIDMLADTELELTFKHPEESASGSTIWVHMIKEDGQPLLLRPTTTNATRPYLNLSLTTYLDKPIALKEDIDIALIGQDLTPLLKGEVERFGLLPTDAVQDDIYHCLTKNSTFFGRPAGYYQALVDNPVRDLSTLGWKKVSSASLPIYKSTNSLDKYQQYTPNDITSFTNYPIASGDDLASGAILTDDLSSFAPSGIDSIARYVRDEVFQASGTDITTPLNKTYVRRFAPKDVYDIAIVASEVNLPLLATGSDMTSPEGKTEEKIFTPDNIHTISHGVASDLINGIDSTLKPLPTTSNTIHTLKEGVTYYLSANVSIGTGYYRMPAQGEVTILGQGHMISSSDVSTLYLDDMRGSRLNLIDLSITSSHSTQSAIDSKTATHGSVYIEGGTYKGNKRCIESEGSVSFTMVNVVFEKIGTGASAALVFGAGVSGKASNVSATGCLFMTNGTYSNLYFSGLHQSISITNCSIQKLGTEGTSTPIRFTDYAGNIDSFGICTISNVTFLNTRQADLIYSDSTATWDTLMCSNLRYLYNSGVLWNYKWATGALSQVSMNSPVIPNFSTSVI